MSASRTWLNVLRAEKSQSLSEAVATWYPKGVAKAQSPVLDKVKSSSGLPVLRLHSSLRSSLRSHRPGILREELLISCHCEEDISRQSNLHNSKGDCHVAGVCSSQRRIISLSAHQSGHPKDGHRYHPLQPTHRGGPVLSTSRAQGQRSCLHCGWWIDDER